MRSKRLRNKRMRNLIMQSLIKFANSSSAFLNPAKAYSIFYFHFTTFSGQSKSLRVFQIF